MSDVVNLLMFCLVCSFIICVTFSRAA